MKKILFVCLGNICRSPSAEAVMNKLVLEAGFQDQIICDSAGTSATHSGEKADPRSIHHASQRSYEVTSISRKLYPFKDFGEFDYIIAMDNNNYRDIARLAAPKELDGKLFRMCDFCSKRTETEVPDPYYDGERGFETVLDILEDACSGLLTEVRKGL
jgi:protein-tyrosine phosphatase